MLLYVERQYGKICAIHHSPKENASEKKLLLDKEIVEFMGQDSDGLEKLLALTDLDTVRIVEDLIDLLMAKNIIRFTDLPEAAQMKIRERKQVRKTLAETNIIVEDVI